MATSPLTIPTKKRILAATIAAFIITALLGTGIVVIVEKNRTQKQEQIVNDITSRVADNIQDHLNRSISATYALAAIIRQNNGHIHDFESLASEMLVQYDGMSSLAVAPQGIVSSIVPLAGNEKAIGHSLLEDVKHNKKAILTENTRKLTLAGPFELLQGGRAVVGRLPVFIKTADGTDRFWGFTAVIVGIPQLMKSANLQQIVESGYQYELSRIHPDSGKRDVFERSAVAALSSPVSHNIEVPNGTWTLSVEQEGSWFSPLIILCKITLVLLVSSLISFMLHTLYKLPLTLQQSEEQFRALATIAPVGIFYADSDGNFLYVNPEWRKVTGLSLEESLGVGWVKGLHPDDRDMVYTSWNKMVESHGQWELEYRFMTGESKITWVHGLAASQQDASGKIIKYVGIMQDITARKSAEEKLKNNSYLNELLLNSLPHPAMLIRKNRTVIAANLFAKEVGAQIGGYCWHDFGHSQFITDQDKEYIKEHQKLPTCGTHCDFCLADKALATQGSANQPAVEVFGRFFDTYWIYLHDDVYLHYAIDITDRRLAEQEKLALEKQLQQTQKLESLGVLVGGISHDFNNILNIIMGYCYIIDGDIDSGLDQKTVVKKIEAAARRASDLCRQMLTYAGKNISVHTHINMWMMIDEIAKMLTSVIKKNVCIEYDLNNDMLLISGDSAQIQQVIMNLIINASEAIGDKNGAIKIVLEKETVQDGQTETDYFGTVIQPGDYVRLEVSDNGCGMDDETQKRIFEPFYTTKLTGRGLGMSTVLGIIKSHNGLLTLSSTPRVGTTFKFWFPLSASPCISSNVQTTKFLTAEKGNGTILLVDDEEGLLMIGSALLKAMGFSVVTATNGLEALEIFRKRKSEIDLILLDLLMPEMGGNEAYCILRKISPTLPIAICSGYEVGNIQEYIYNDEHSAIILKPYNPVQLRDTLMRLKTNMEKQ